MWFSGRYMHTQISLSPHMSIIWRWQLITLVCVYQHHSTEHNKRLNLSLSLSFLLCRCHPVRVTCAGKNRMVAWAMGHHRHIYILLWILHIIMCLCMTMTMFIHNTYNGPKMGHPRYSRSHNNLLAPFEALHKHTKPRARAYEKKEKKRIRK